jgi:hypothetical protein
MKPLIRSFRLAALSLATVAMGLAPALAAPSPNLPSNLHLMSTNARLNRAINSSRVSVGQRVTARLTMDLHTRHGIFLPRNAQLIGKVSQLQSGHGKMTRIALVFTRARLKDGHVIPIKATLLGAMPPFAGGYYGSSNNFPDLSKPVAADASIDQESGVLSHVALHAAVQSRNSGIFLSKRDKIRLPAGTQLRIAIAPLQPSTTAAG